MHVWLICVCAHVLYVLDLHLQLYQILHSSSVGGGSASESIKENDEGRFLLLRLKPARLSANMADSKPPKTEAPVATRIDPTKEGLSREQMHFIRQVEMEQWKKKTSKLRTRNVVTGLAIGAIVLGICILPMNTRGKRKVKHVTLAQRAKVYLCHFILL